MSLTLVLLLTSSEISMVYCKVILVLGINEEQKKALNYISTEELSRLQTLDSGNAKCRRKLETIDSHSDKVKIKNG